MEDEARGHMTLSSILRWFLLGTWSIFMAVGYPNQDAISIFFFGAGGILFYYSGLYEWFSSLEEQSERERAEFAETIRHARSEKAHTEGDKSISEDEITTLHCRVRGVIKPNELNTNPNEELHRNHNPRGTNI